MTRRRFRIPYRRERVELPDGDFLDIDESAPASNRYPDTTILALHGLEGDSDAPYVKSFAKASNERGLSFIALNMRGCSGTMNRLPRFYHSGETGDLKAVVGHLSSRFRRVALLGFSLGGNVVLKALGEDAGGEWTKSVFGALAYSVPLDLSGSARKIGQVENRFYMRRFIRMLAAKIEAKAQLFPLEIDPSGCRDLRNFEEFDGRYTAPLNGFESAEDYWRRSSALPLLNEIEIPSLLVNALNDPFLSERCYPADLAEAHERFYACFPNHGGHVGFPSIRSGGESWHEALGLDFLMKRLESYSTPAI